MDIGEPPAERPRGSAAKRPLYITIQERIRQRIVSGIYPEEQRIPGSRELAQEFQTTTVTVDKALARLVGHGYIHRRSRIGSVVNPRRFWDSAGPHARRSGLIGALLFDTASPWFWAKAVRGMEDALNERDHHLVICNSDGSTQKSLQYVEDLVRKGIDGLIIAPFRMPTHAEYERENLKVLHRADELQVPRILFDCRLDGRRDSVVMTDNRGDTADAVRSLVQSGVRSPVCVTGDYYAWDIAEREQGFRDALQETFPDAETRIVRIGPHSAQADESDLVVSTLRARPDIDAIFAVDAVSLVSALRSVRSDPELARRDIAFVNYDQIETAEREQITLSVVQPAYEMGYAAGDLIADKARRWRGATIVQIQFPCEIQEGGAYDPR